MKVSLTQFCTWRNAYRIYNGLAAGLATWEFFNNPTADPLEFIPDITCHAWEAIFPESLPLAAFAMNFSRSAQSLEAYLSGESSFSSTANLIDTLAHFINAKVRLGYCVKGACEGLFKDYWSTLRGSGYSAESGTGKPILHQRSLAESRGHEVLSDSVVAHSELASSRPEKKKF